MEIPPEALAGLSVVASVAGAGAVAAAKAIAQRFGAKAALRVGGDREATLPETEVETLRARVAAADERLEKRHDELVKLASSAAQTMAQAGGQMGGLAEGVDGLVTEMRAMVAEVKDLARDVRELAREVRK